MISMTTSKAASAHPHPDVASLTTTECPSESKALPNALRVKARATRRRGKRDGPFQLQFVTATDPSQSKDEEARRSVRSQAMRYHRNKPSKETKTPQNRPETVLPLYTGPMADEQAKPANAQAQLSIPKPISITSGALVRYAQEQRVGTHASTRTRSPMDASEGSPRNAESNDDQPPRPSGDIRSRKSQSKTCEKVVDYEYSESQQEHKTRLLAITFSRIGDGVDPFIVLPQFESPGLNSVFLLRNFTGMRAFGTEAYVEKWVPGMLSHPHILLSTVFLACNWLDMHAKLPGESITTALVRDEIIGMLNERLRHPNKDNAASTIVIILHLLAGEIWSCNERILQWHVSGIAKMVTLCGGIDKLGKAIIAEVSAACCFQCDLVYEAEPLLAFMSWQMGKYSPPDDDVAIPESPLFCPRPDFVTILKDERCSLSIRGLLRDMRDLTDLFLSHNAILEVPSDIDEIHPAFSHSADVDYNAWVAELRERLTNLLPAYIPGHPDSGDWVYEACRLTAMIYTASIICSLPFSIVAEPGQNPLWSGAEASKELHNSEILLTTNLSEMLWEALERTDLANVWNGMAGVLYWICTVGAAAARTPTVLTSSQRDRYRKPCKFRVRQCLTMLSMRAMVVLVFEHPMPILLSQKKLLRVQELVGTHG